MSHTLTQDLWSRVKSDLQALFSEDVFSTWFADIECLSQNEESIVLGVPSDFALIWVQNNYADLLAQHLRKGLGHDLALRFEVSPGADASNGVMSKQEPAASARLGSPRNTRHSVRERNPLPINPRNTFDNFVVGPGSQLAHAASIAVANAPAKAYNPLFIYGDTGLGKTHLMHAIAHCIQRNNPDADIAYISTEKFANKFIDAIRENTMAQFRRRYRKVDILLIDDIHFLSGKERTQEEFFHTFNDLFESQRQIVLSSDRPVSEIADLQSRLVSRFQWGLVADIQPPDFETRVAILAKKAAAMRLALPREILEFLAERVSRNVRRMEGALTRVAGYTAIHSERIDIPTVERLLQDIFQEEAQSQVTIDKIQAKVAGYYKIPIDDMKSRRRPAEIAFARQVAMYLSRMLTSHSLQQIGAAFGNRDHGTVIHACRQVENMMEQEESTRRGVEYLQMQLSSHR